MSELYRVPLEVFEREIEVKKSRFIATAMPVASESEMRRFIESQRLRFPGANHHCSAYIIGSPFHPRAAGSDDDGEPSGTAGKPMLNVLMGQQIGDVCVVVTRFFGGIKLGAGGLVRAYGAAVKELVPEWPLAEREPMASLTLRYPYDQQGWIDSLLKRFEADVSGSDYTEAVTQQLTLPQRNQELFCHEVAERAHLGVSCEVMD